DELRHQMKQRLMEMFIYVWVTKINSTIPSTTTSVTTTATSKTTTTISGPTQTIVNSQSSSNNVNYGLIIGISIGA
ncbi:17305_t:CDS:1, partial [Dentiscutata erythropus]